jgi:hypothetical protein
MIPLFSIYENLTFKQTDGENQSRDSLSNGLITGGYIIYCWKMSDNRLSLYLDCFTFGGPPRRIFYAVILEGVFLLGLFSFTSEGLLDTSVVPRFTEVLTVAAVVTGLGVYLISRSAAKDSFSSILHTDFVPGLIAAGYLFLGGLATGIGFLLHTWVYQTPLPPTNKEIWVGLCIGVIFGFSILFYFDRYEIEAPDDYYQFEKASEGLIEAKEFLEKTELPPIDLTGRYKALEESMQETADVLKKAKTQDGARLAQDVEACLDDLHGRPEPSKHLIAGDSQSPNQQELKDRRQELKSVIKRIKRIANHG